MKTEATEAWMDARNSEHDPAEQIRLHASVRKTVGVISAKNPERAKHTKKTIRKRLAGHYGR